MGQPDRSDGDGRGDRGTAAVTGASSGIGRAFARELARRGCDLLLIARRLERLEDLAGELSSACGVSAEAWPADLSRDDDVSRLQRRLAGTPDLEVLVNNAGFGVRGSFLDADPDRQLEMIAVHVVASVRLVRAALPPMLARGRGAVINVSSLAGFRGLPGRATYSATKAYLNRFSEALQGELAGTGVRVQALCPGFTRTEFHDAPELRRARREVPEWLWMDPEAVVAASLKALRGRRVICIPGWKSRLLAALSRSLLAGPILRLTARRARRRRAAGPGRGT